MSEQPMMMSAGQIATTKAPTGTSVWTPRAGHYGAVAVADAERAHRAVIEKPLDQVTGRPRGQTAPRHRVRTS
jgi:hypothetical protein